MSMEENTKNQPEDYLRPEAQPFKFDELNGNQKKAFKKIMKKLKVAVNVLDNNESSDSSLANPTVPPVYTSNWNPIVFLSGERGSGKTSLLLTLMEEYRKFKTQEKSNFERDLYQRLIWLEPLDMDPLPGPTNLLAAILARIEEAIGRFYESFFDSRSHVKSQLEPYPDDQKLLTELNKLQQDVGLAWDGNIKERAANLDPDSFAVELLRAEGSRLCLNLPESQGLRGNRIKY